MTALRVGATSQKSGARTGGSWALRLRLTFLTVSVVAYIATLIPGLLVRHSVLRATAESRAVALAQWLAAEAAQRLDAGTVAGASADRVREEPGVVAARVLNLQGGVLAPDTEANQVFRSIPGLNIAPETVRTVRTEWTEDVIEVACPVMTREGRVAVAWLTFRSAEPPGEASVAVPLFVPLMIAVVCGLICAAAVQRHVIAGLRRFNDDIELATRGDLENVSDPLGIEALREVASSVNYLVDRLKSAEVRAHAQLGGDVQPFAAPQPEPVSRPPRPQAPAPAPVSSARSSSGAWLVASEQLRIVDAGPALAGIVTDPASIIGRHLLDAIADSTIVEAMLDCLGKVRAGGTAQTLARSTGGSDSVQVIVEKRADRTVRVSFLSAQR